MLSRNAGMIFMRVKLAKMTEFLFSFSLNQEQDKNSRILDFQKALYLNNSDKVFSKVT